MDFFVASFALQLLLLNDLLLWTVLIGNLTNPIVYYPVPGPQLSITISSKKEYPVIPYYFVDHLSENLFWQP